MTINSPYLATKHASAKIACLIITLVVTLASYFAYSDSPWYSEDLAIKCAIGHAYNVSILKWNVTEVSSSFEMSTAHCPSLIMERFFVYSNIFILISCVISFIYSCQTDAYILNEIRGRDATFHATAGVVLLVGAILQVVSIAGVVSNKCTVHHDIDVSPSTRREHPEEYQGDHHKCGDYFLHDNKYVAAGLGFAEAIIFWFTACVIENVKLHGLHVPRKHTEGGGGGGGSAINIHQSHTSIRPNSTPSHNGMGMLTHQRLHNSGTTLRRVASGDSIRSIKVGRPSIQKTII